MAYTTIDKPDDYFQTELWSSVDTSIDTINFAPDWVWIKSRTNADTQVLFDTVRGENKRLSSSGSTAEQTTTGELTAFNSDGYTLGTGDNVNRSSHNYVSWNWKAGTSVSGNTGGSGTAKTYSGSVNTDAGFSIINFVGNGTAGHTIPHHLGVAPKMVIVKNRTSASTNWQTYHYNLDDGAGTHEIFLDLTSASNASGGAWNNTAPTSTVVTKGTGSYGNENNSNHIMYSFSEVKGYSKFGKYTGNGNADGTFVYTGFKPSYVMVKRTDSADDWTIVDNERIGFNPNNRFLYANSNSAEETLNDRFYLLSNGFKLKNSWSKINASSGTYIYMAFAENPFTTSTGICCTAR